MNKKIVRFTLRAAVLTALSVAGTLGPGSTAQAAKPGGGSGCPRDILCYDLYAPVICSNGVVYSNDCYAYRACATGCVPYGSGGPVGI